MQKLLLALLFLLPAFLKAQDDDVDPFDRYGPPGAPVFTNLKDAVKAPAACYRLKLDNQIIEAKLLPKIGKLDQLQALQLNANGLTQLPSEFVNLTNLIYFACIENPILLNSEAHLYFRR